MTASRQSALALAGLSLLAISSQASIIEDFSATVGSSIQFNGAGSSFQFDPSSASGKDWQITGQSGGTGSTVGLFGLFTGGPFSYGPITTQVSGPLTLETAAVTGPLGGLTIFSPSGNLTGTIDWAQISTINSAGGINADLQVNVTGLSYSGADPDLNTLAADNLGTLVVSFQFTPGLTLAQLSSGDGPFETSYSGTLSAPDSSYTAFLLIGSLGAALWLFQPSRRARPAHAHVRPND